MEFKKDWILSSLIIQLLYCVTSFKSVAAFGHQMIERTKQFVEDKYCIANSFKHDAKVLLRYY